MIKKFKSLLFSQTAKQTSLLFSANFFDALTALVITILLARTLLPAKFGLYSAFINFILLVASILDLGIGSALIRFLPVTKSYSQKRKFIRSAIFFNSLCALTTAILILVLSSMINRYLFSSLTNLSFLFWASAGIFVLTLQGLLSQILQAKLQFARAALVNYIYSLTRLISILLLFTFHSLTLQTAIIVTALGPLLALVYMLWLSFNNHELGSPTSGLLNKILHFGRWIAIVNLNSAASSRLDSLLLLNLSGAHATGIYSAASKPVAFLPLLTNSFGKVIAPKFSRQNTRAKLLAFTLKSYLGSLFLILAAIFLMLVAPMFVKIVYGADYLASVGVIRLLLLSQIPYLLAFPLTNVLVYSFKQPHLLTIISTGQTLTILFGGLLLIPHLHTSGLVMAIAASNLWLLATSLFFFLRRL